MTKSAEHQPISEQDKFKDTVSDYIIINEEHWSFFCFIFSVTVYAIYCFFQMFDYLDIVGYLLSLLLLLSLVVLLLLILFYSLL